MKCIFLYGTTVLALSAAPLLAQSSQPQGAAQQPRTGPTDQSGSKPGPTRDASPRSQSPSQTGSKSRAAAEGQAKSTHSTDQQFVLEAAGGSLAEVELGQLASEKAAVAAVKQFGQRMVEDHTKANDELKEIAQRKNITLPTAMDAKHKATHDRLAKMSGEAFDRAYMREMVTGHQMMLDMFRKESQNGSDADVKAWAAKMVPSIQEHLNMAQTASRTAVGTSGRAPSNGSGSGSPGTRGAIGGSSKPDKSSSGNPDSGRPNTSGRPPDNSPR